MDMKTRVGRKHSLQRGTSGQIGRDTSGIAMVIKILCDFSLMNMILEEICSVGIFVCEKLCINNLLKSKQSNYNDMWIMINGDGDIYIMMKCLCVCHEK